MTPFEVVLAGAGAFPGDRRPRAIWLGIERGADELGTISRGPGRRPRAHGHGPRRPAVPPAPHGGTDGRGRHGGVAGGRGGAPGRGRGVARPLHRGARRALPQSPRRWTAAVRAAARGRPRGAERSETIARTGSETLGLRRALQRLLRPNARTEVARRWPRPTPPDQVPPGRGPDPAGLVQHRGRPPDPAPAPAAPGHGPADRPSRPRAAVPDGADPPGGQHRPRDRDPGPGPRGVPALPAVAAAPRLPPGAGARYAGAHLLQVRGRQPGRAATSRTPRWRRRSSTRRRASSALPPRPAPASGGARWRSRAPCSASRSRSTWSGPATTRSRTAGS